VTVFIELVKACAIVIAATLLGNWFLSEVRESRRKKAPWYAPYVSPPGILIICFIVLLPIIFWIFAK